VSKNRKVKVWQRAGETNHHHIINKKNGGTWFPGNIIVWDKHIHAAWHFLFGDMTIREVAEWLIFIDEQKKLGIDTDLQK
jgi:hypothetical protein